MKFILLFLPLVAKVAGELPPEPVAHLTPPPSQSSVRAARNESTTDPHGTESQKQQQHEARAIEWAAPAHPPLSSHRGRTSDCNPCDSVPWVPVARSLNMPQYALSIPAIQLTLPVNYGIPVAQMRPQPQFKTQQINPSQNYGPPQPSQSYGPPPSAPSQNHGPTQPSQSYGPPPSAPSQNHGPPQPSQSYGPPPSAPSQNHGPPPPSQSYGSPPSAPSQNYGPPKPSQSYGPPPSAPSQNHGPPPSAPSQNYGPPRPAPSQSYGPPPATNYQNYGPPRPAPSQSYGPPPTAPSQNYGPPRPAPSQNYGAPPSSPSQNYGPPPSPHSQTFGVPFSKIGNLRSEESGPAVSDHKTSASTPSQHEPTEDDKHGLPPPPLPQRFLSPTYGPPKPQTQLVSATNINPTENKVLPHPAPFTPNVQLLPFVKFGPHFDPQQYQNQNTHKFPIFQNNIRANNQQYRGESVKRPVSIQNPIQHQPVSKTQSPNLSNYQVSNDGKQGDLHPYLQPPKAHNVIFTITETEDSCKKCQEQSHLKDSEPAPAEHATENIVKTTTQTERKPSDQQKSSVQVVKSVPLAEYLSSIEYPMQVIQAPILDVPELNKYFDLGYHNFPQIQNLQAHIKTDQLTSQTLGQPIKHNSHYFNQNLPVPKGDNFAKATATSLDDVSLTDYQDQTTNSLPHNHKSNALLNHQTTSKTSTTSSYAQTTPLFTSPTTRPSQILHISKSRPSSQTEPVKHSTDALPATSTSGHYVTSQPLTSTKVTSTTSSTILEPAQSPSQNYPSTVTTAGRGPTGTSNLRPNLDSSATRDWSYGRVRGNNTPQPFSIEPSSPQKPRFLVRPTPNTTKKAKHIHQIIVPYTTNRQTSAVPDSTSLGWTPLPPTNQARKVPPNSIFGDYLPSSTGFDQLQNYQNSFPSGGSPTGPNVQFKSESTSNPEIQPMFPTANGQPINLPPQVINHLLHLNQQGNFWPSGPEGLQQLLKTNLQGLLRGEEDSVDLTRLQKNIDKWTAEGYKQNSPSANFVPVTAMPHIFHSKKIPDAYLTSTEATHTNSSHNHYPHSADFDHDFAESQKLQIKVHPLAHTKDHEQPQDSSATIESLLNSWSLLDTKVVTTFSPTTAETSTSSTEPTSKAWEKTQVSISPLTKEKVYVVTPVPDVEESSTSLLSTRVERSYSMVSKDDTKQ